MATDSEENTLSSPTVRFDLEGSQHHDEFDASLDEVDEFLELSTLSNLQSTPSSDSLTNVVTNGVATNAKKTAMNGVTSENKSALNRYKR